ncbi:MAG: tRNA 5-methylaminomethyl-2-thiouridine biosynthesis protein MnmC [Pseudomonadota bacterium]|jgi:tRNA 5-methylaminomethyl-2-thiouridine biosynthesis bifunctional protein
MMTRGASPFPRDDPLRGASEGRLAAAGLPSAWRGRERCVVLELGFGSGEALLAARRAWHVDPARCGHLHWAAWLPAPLARDLLEARLETMRVPRDAQRALLRHWPPAIDGVHRVPIDDGRIVLTLAIGDARRRLPGWVPRADALLVGLDPDAPPLDAAALRAAAAMLADDGLAGVGPQPSASCAGAGARSPTGVADCTAAALRALESAGLGFEAAGSEACQRGRRVRGRGAAAGPPPTSDARRALVVGGGLAGSAASAALARRGWSVTRIDGRAPRGSSQPVLAQHPSLTPDDAPLSRLTRAATLLSWTDPTIAAVLRPHGRVQLADDARAHAVCAMLPRDWVAPVDAAEASRRAGIPLRRGGWWLPRAGSADPDVLRAAWTTSGVQVVADVELACIERRTAGWAAVDPDGATLAEAPVVLLAPGAHPLWIRRDVQPARVPLAALLGPAGLQRRAGATTVATLPSAAVPRCTVGGDGHAVPIDATRLLLGPPGTPDDDLPDGHDTAARAWRRWTEVLAAPPPEPRLDPGRAGERLSTRDHLPLVGAVPDPDAIAARRAAGTRRDDRAPLPSLDGLWLATAFGGRGLLWSVLAAELVAARLAGEPMPLEAELSRRLEPDRFLRHALRRTDTAG